METNTSALVLNAENLHASYGQVKALTGASLQLSSGEVCALIGMNGSGKSTFFKSIMGIVATSQGKITICGQDSLTARKAGLVGYVPQNEDIDHHFPLSVEEVVMMGRYCFMGPLRRPRAADREAVQEAIESIGLKELSKRPIGALSGGQRKRAFVARALAQGAKLMLLDEPFAGVDYTSEHAITDLISELAEQNTTLLVSTHDLTAVPKFAHKVALINRRILKVGKPTETLTPEHLLAAFTESTARSAQIALGGLA
ncbi:metal ABC transporter ATP-binding protein [Gleimia sp. 6138-11-ORH1]|uniref:metal ABC transporter ATP-binding protein n=1 Tax=Gleimia sp. 6138-11-ORH1 TaxID=2973937 RepID=UPI00216795BB|nr:metal ABC transporter ATP-binding protein [Gleimia sp. 6138-11-ORH1]MCS4484842.1 metal ABC transporter ATP-binding protein [Gleimia sp. 6138-11-ORH1]